MTEVLSHTKESRPQNKKKIGGDDGDAIVGCLRIIKEETDYNHTTSGIITIEPRIYTHCNECTMPHLKALFVVGVAK